ncbi:hypothetical protein DMB65_07405 [Flavobacterium cheongpyeongense]|uniref:Uncharacterized protein n=1 Tax=Flavobacterium cheongpyeongense TaxID=2212651 RepID=A0A2V4C4U4_9FLAO|nr:hypothetical protein [Flavobacterium cheongpyeongense]PXY41224.1 hypothetical protein DMB65_07405 [Flavobacterium cheongpyeongense]
MKKIIKGILVFLIPALFFTACMNEDLIPVLQEQKAGKILIRGYNALQDSIQISIDGKLLVIDKNTAFVNKITKDHAFVFYNNAPKRIEVINKVSKEVLRSYNFTVAKPVDTLSFYTGKNIYISKVLSYKPVVLTVAGHVGFRFIFPTLNRYSNSGYKGSVDAILKKTNGQMIGIAENINQDGFNSFLEFAYVAPPVINVELVKHGTTESYVPGMQVKLQMIIQNNKSKLIVLDEKANEAGVFTGVDGNINLVDYFTF